jgi:hypothetical protein
MYVVCVMPKTDTVLKHTQMAPHTREMHACSYATRNKPLFGCKFGDATEQQLSALNENA